MGKTAHGLPTPTRPSADLQRQSAAGHTAAWLPAVHTSPLLTRLGFCGGKSTFTWQHPPRPSLGRVRPATRSCSRGEHPRERQTEALRDRQTREVLLGKFTPSFSSALSFMMCCHRRFSSDCNHASFALQRPKAPALARRPKARTGEGRAEAAERGALAPRAPPYPCPRLLGVCPRCCRPSLVPSGISSKQIPDYFLGFICWASA